MRALSIGFAAAALAASALLAQSEPYKVFETRPVITEGPYLVAMSDTSVSIVWMTDAPSHSKVKFGAGGAMDQVSEPDVNGLAPVGLRHVVTLTGLKPGTNYSYQASSTRVVKLKAYWPDKGLETLTPVKTFTTFDAQKSTASLAAISDTHENTTRIAALMKMIPWRPTPAGVDALLHLGDAFDWLDDEEQLLTKWMRPISAALAGTTPLIYARGNHELRGPFARNLFDYVPTPEGTFYYAREIGPIHLMVVDSGEDKPDNTNVYADLNKTIAYRARELAWLRSHLATHPRVKAAPFRIVAMHQPKWGWLENGNGEWLKLANDANVDLVIAGHNHKFSEEPPNAEHKYHLVVVGQDQAAFVNATRTGLTVTVKGTDGSVVKDIVVR